MKTLKVLKFLVGGSRSQGLSGVIRANRFARFARITKCFVRIGLTRYKKLGFQLRTIRANRFARIALRIARATKHRGFENILPLCWLFKSIYASQKWLPRMPRQGSLFLGWTPNVCEPPKSEGTLCGSSEGFKIPRLTLMKRLPQYPNFRARLRGPTQGDKPSPNGDFRRFSLIFADSYLFLENRSI